MKKLIIDSKVAVLISPNYGAGWSTWNNACEEMIFDYNIASMLHNQIDFNEIVKYAQETYPKKCLLGLNEITIEWLSQDTRFQIREYDGYESIEICEEQKWLIA